MCIQNKQEIEALAVGLTLVGKGRNALYRLYRFNQCGHEKEIQAVHVRKNNFRCNQCISDKLEKEALAVGLTLIGKGRDYQYRLYRFNQCGHEQEITTGEVRKNNFKCSQCLSNKQEQEALKVGLTLIGKGRNSSYRLYRFNQCGHEQEMQVTHVRGNRLKCKQCLSNKLEQEALGVGLTLIGNGRNAQYRLYRFNQCGHEQELKTGEVRTNNFRCKQCYDIKLKQEALDVGLTLIGKGRNACYRLYRFNQCSHEQELATGEVRKSNFRCNQCLSDKMEKEALDVGLTLIGKGRDRHYRLYRFNQCGHDQDIAISSIRTNSFDCQQCGESAWTKESGLYSLLITDKGKSWFKVGTARDVNKRIKQYGLSDTATVDINYFIKIKDRITATTVEKFIQINKLKPYQLPPEEMKGYMKQGFTECYSLEAVDLIKTIFSKVESKFN